MKALAPRLVATATFALLGWLLIAGTSGGGRGPILEPDKLVILSTVDVKGKTSPCG